MRPRSEPVYDNSGRAREDKLAREVAFGQMLDAWLNRLPMEPTFEASCGRLSLKPTLAPQWPQLAANQPSRLCACAHRAEG